MRAVVLREFGGPEKLLWQEVPTPEPQAGEVLLQVGAVSVDLFQMEFRSGRALQIPLPRIMGNGPAGTVAALGPGVTGVREGTRVVVANNVSCGACRMCLRGRETLCRGLNNHRGGMIGAHRDGGFAEYVAVPARNLLPLPDDVSFEHACLVPNTIGPVVKACSARAGIRAGENVVIIGAGGGMGLHAVQMARACGGHVTAVIRSERTRDAVAACGAHEILAIGPETLAQEVRRRTDDWGADVVLDFVANRETLAASIAALAPAGRLVIMGYFPRGSVLESLTWPFTEEIVVTGNRSAGRNDVVESLTLIRNGQIRPVVAQVFPMREAAQAHRAFESRSLVGRAVLVN